MGRVSASDGIFAERKAGGGGKSGVSTVRHRLAFLAPPTTMKYVPASVRSANTLAHGLDGSLVASRVLLVGTPS